MTQTRLEEIKSVFRVLGLATEADRRRFRLMTDNEPTPVAATNPRREDADTRNNTASEEEDAELESAP